MEVLIHCHWQCIATQRACQQSVTEFRRIRAAGTAVAMGRLAAELPRHESALEFLRFILDRPGNGGAIRDLRRTQETPSASCGSVNKMAN